MKTTLLLLLTAMGLHAAEVPLPPFTNSVGVVVSNAVAVKALQSGLQYSIPNGGGVIPWKKVTPDIKEKFGRTPVMDLQAEIAEIKQKLTKENELADAAKAGELAAIDARAGITGKSKSARVEIQLVEVKYGHARWSYKITVPNDGPARTVHGDIVFADSKGFAIKEWFQEKTTIPKGGAVLTGTAPIELPAGSRVAQAFFNPVWRD